MLFDRPLFAANSSNSSPDRGMKEEGWRWKTTATQTLSRREEEEEAGDDKKRSSRMRLSHLPSSRIFRVSRASGGKDRHSKVYTSKGLRDRRIRLSVSTAIQFYDLQDRLGYDQPSKAIEWLIQAAAASIAELPSLEYSFSDDMPLAIEGGGEPSTSETSKGSVLSLSRSAIRVVKDDDDDDDKERDEEDDHNVVEEVSFTKLLTGGSSNSNSNGNGDYIPSGFSSQMEMQQFGLFQEHYYSISPTLSGFHRGTLQSNSPSHHHHQEPFFFSAVANTAAASPTENPYAAGFDGHLQLCEGYEQLKLKGKGRS